MMGRLQREYCLMLILILGIGNIIIAQPLTPHATLQTCECWTAPDDASLQIGNVILTFSDNPMVHPLPSTIYTKKNEHIFFIPTADVSADQLHTIMESVKKNNNKWYSLTISPEKKPIAGIKVVFTYDPDIVSMDHIMFDTLGTQKGILFRLYNKAMINALKAKERSLLRVTQLKPLHVMA